MVPEFKGRGIYHLVKSASAKPYILRWLLTWNMIFPFYWWAVLGCPFSIALRDLPCTAEVKKQSGLHQCPSCFCPTLRQFPFDSWYRFVWKWFTPKSFRPFQDSTPFSDIPKYHIVRWYITYVSWINPSSCSPQTPWNSVKREETCPLWRPSLRLWTTARTAWWGPTTSGKWTGLHKRLGGDFSLGGWHLSKKARWDEVLNTLVGRYMWPF